MSNTVRNYRPGFTGEFATLLKRGLISIPKSDELGDEVWGQSGKKFRRKFLSRKQRIANKKIIAEFLNNYYED